MTKMRGVETLLALTPEGLKTVQNYVVSTGRKGRKK